MAKLFSQPFPRHQGTKRLILIAFAFGIFITLFLLIFQPFDVNLIPEGNFKILFLCGFGIITIITTIVYQLLLGWIFSQWFEEKNWTVGKEILNIAGIVLVVSIFNLVYTDYIFNRTFHFSQIPYWSGTTLLIGIFPVAFSVILKQGKMKRESEGVALEINSEIEQRKDQPHASADSGIATWLFYSENEKEKFETDEHHLFFIESADNYSTLYFSENNQVKKQMLRGSLKKMEEQVKHPSLFRCHRTYIVNLSKVVSVSGNAQGYRLNFEGTDLTVPVSRNLGKELKEKLQ